MALFCIVAKDFENGLEHRMAAREAHIALGDKLVQEGKLLFGAAIILKKARCGGLSLLVSFLIGTLSISGY